MKLRHAAARIDVFPLRPASASAQPRARQWNNA